MHDAWTRLEIDGLGCVEVRRPTLRDTLEAKAETVWWWRCVRIEGRIATEQQVLDLDIDHANAIASEVMRPRPFQPPKGGSGG